jgi:hydrogenase/urease accessory protein HupE
VGLVLALFLVFAPVALWAHPISVAFAEIKVEDGQVRWRLHIPAPDMERFFSIDGPPELPSAETRVHEYLARKVKVFDDGRELPGTFGPLQLWSDPDGNPYVETTATFPLADSGLRRLTLVCDLLRELSEGYQTVAWITAAGRTEQLVFQRGQPYETSFAESGHWLASFAAFVQMGVMHIFTGYDHIAFLLGVVLMGGSFKSIVKIVTAFTVAHSITLALATLNLVSIPGRIVESGIALSIMYIAAENLFFKKFDRRWIVTFFFGLVHGFGFASALSEIHLSRNLLATALFSFNLGVEVGQVAIVALLLPVLWYLARQSYNTLVIRCCSGVIFLLGSYWLWERVR